MRITPERTFLATLIGIAVLLPVTQAQVRPIYDQGASGLYQVLQQLQTTASVMHTGAHPDDEDSALLAYLARREHARTTYLALTRGDGGQNLIGAELSENLGVIRTEELLQSRKLDGAEQLFTRAVDFGFSERRTEAARVWDEDVVLGDMVRAIRRFRPQVVVSRFTGTPADGHGHHQFAGFLTPKAVAAAADPKRFPEHIAAGLLPWRTLKFYVSGDPGIAADDRLLLLNTGERSTVMGRSYYEVAMEGRSQQKTQQMGSLELRGPQMSGVRLVESTVRSPPPESSIFDGIDTSLQGIAGYEPEPDATLARELRALARIAAAALGSYEPLHPKKLVPLLIQGLRAARRAEARATHPDTRRLLAQKAGEFEGALKLAAGITVDALADAETVVPGGSMQATVRVYINEGLDAGDAVVSMRLPDGWSAVADASEPDSNSDECPAHESRFLIALPDDAAVTQPYWLVHRRPGAMFDWSAAGAAQNLPFGPELISAEVRLRVSGETLSIRQPFEFRFADGVRGEVRRRIDVVPAISVSPGSGLLIAPSTNQEKSYELSMAVSNHSTDTMTGSAFFTLPPGWTLQPEAVTFTLPALSNTLLRFELDIPGDTEAGRYSITPTARSGDRPYQQTLQEIAYPHIRTHRVYRDSAVTVQVLDLEVAPVKVGYVMGSGDSVPDAIRRMGIDITMLDDVELSTGDLGIYDTIVIGIRASTTRPAFVSNNARLLDYARLGGTLVVQYQQEDYFVREMPPYPASMASTVRTVDETAPVTILRPEHALFNFPNRISPGDFDDWIQERNGYTFTDFDRGHYVALLETHDPGEPESIGGMMYAKVGAGHYVYTSYAWFRQLPHGVPGAYRIFANVLSLPKSP